ncbi:SPOSA6832_00621 [Sporobolomyces salmonicolor]|uniref:SPOSA6832_00621-mRNA-1:cds n=1 Tax=Sporidiobolus salmonicolor TaxID=5005 RepID=A0A0D6EHP1_SPOSA|nr:SPOSA6832_00621 [Sporobolomyces salmonicolor]
MAALASPHTLDGALAATLFPRLVQLAKLSSLESPSSSAAGAIDDAEARAAKLEVNKQASQLRTSLATLQAQAQNLSAGNMSLDDQTWLIEQLEKEVERKRSELAEMVQLTSFTAKATKEDAMETE